MLPQVRLLSKVARVAAAVTVPTLRLVTRGRLGRKAVTAAPVAPPPKPLSRSVRLNAMLPWWGRGLTFFGWVGARGAWRAQGVLLVALRAAGGIHPAAAVVGAVAAVYVIGLALLCLDAMIKAVVMPVLIAMDEWEAAERGLGGSGLGGSGLGGGSAFD